MQSSEAAAVKQVIRHKKEKRRGEGEQHTNERTKIVYGFRCWRGLTQTDLAKMSIADAITIYDDKRYNKNSIIKNDAQVEKKRTFDPQINLISCNC